MPADVNNGIQLAAPGDCTSTTGVDAGFGATALPAGQCPSKLTSLPIEASSNPGHSSFVRGEIMSATKLNTYVFSSLT